MHRLWEGKPPGCDHVPKDLFADAWFARLETMVECIHCERVFRLGDAIWVPLRDDPILAGMWCCAYHPQCDGSLIDFVPTRRRRTHAGLTAPRAH